MPTFLRMLCFVAFIRLRVEALSGCEKGNTVEGKWPRTLSDATWYKARVVADRFFSTDIRRQNAECEENPDDMTCEYIPLERLEVRWEFNNICNTEGFQEDCVL